MTDNLFTTWRELKRAQGLTLTQALNGLNKALGTRYQHGRFKKWEDGERLPKADVLQFILRDVLTTVLKEAGLSPLKIKKIVKACTVHELDS